MTNWTIWVCPDCRQRVSDKDRGHYHDPPEGWPPDDPDPWFNAIEVEVALARPAHEDRKEKDESPSLSPVPVPSTNRRTR